MVKHGYHTIERCFEVMTHARQENVLEFDLQLLLLALLDLGHVHEQKYLHLLVLKVNDTSQARDAFVSDLYLHLMLIFLCLGIR
jgi:hypothetical protein